MYLFQCQNCQFTHQIQGDHSGQDIQCPRCQTPFTIPYAEPQQALAQIQLRLEILEKVGEGGMGMVYRARDTQLDRECALKVLKRELADEERVQRFFREARITARLDHPSIPPIYQFGQTINGDHFILMKLLSGSNFKDLILEHHSGAQDAPDQRQLLDILLKISYALDFAHQRGIVHRDLKPDNVMVGEFGDVTLMDWGIAKDLKGSPSSDDVLLNHPSNIHVTPQEALEAGLTQAGSILGTPGYMSPEQILDSSQVDTSTDIFALGAILSEILTGAVPVEGATIMDKMISTVKGKFVFPTERAKVVPLDLGTLVRSCLEENKDHRIQSAAHFIAELSAYLAQEKLTVYEYSLGERLHRNVAAHPRRWISLVILLAFLSLGLIGALLFQSTQRSSTTSPETPSNPDRPQVEQLLKDAEFDAKLGKLESMSKRLEEALKLGKSEALLLKAAALAKQVNDLERARSYLNEAVNSYPPGYQALFELHILTAVADDSVPKLTKPLAQVLKTAQERGELNLKNPVILLSRALAAQSEKDPQRALELFEQALLLDPQNPWIYLSRAYTLITIKRQKDALNDYNRALELDPSAQNYTSRGTLLEGMLRFDEALDDYNKALKLNPKLSRAYEGRGFVYGAKMNNDKALENLEKAIELGPKNYEPYTRVARIYMAKKDYDAAISSCTKAIQKFPKSVKALLMRAQLLRLKQQPKAALLDLKRVTELADNKIKADAYNVIGLIKTAKKDYKGAEAAFSQAIQANPKLGVGYYNRGYIRLNSGAPKETVLLDYNKCLELQPRTKKARFDRAKLYVALKRFDKAYEDLTIFVKLFPKDWDGHYSLAQVSKALQRFEQAVKSSTRALELNPKHIELQNLRGTALFLSGREEEAITQFTKIIKTKPSYTTALFNRSQIYFKQKKYGKALSDLNLNVRLTPKATNVYESRSRLFQTLRKYREAFGDLEKILQLEPKHPKAREFRARIIRLRKLAS